jgi:hypothetical protein
LGLISLISVEREEFMEKQKTNAISRRDFLKAAGTGAVAIGALSTLGGLAS